MSSAMVRSRGTKASRMRKSTLQCDAVEDCTIPVDVILQSSDGVRLGAHSKNLELFSEAFPAGGTTLSPEGDIVELTEDEDVLRLLLQCTHIPGPDLSSLNLDALFAFGEAANKYGMFYALQIAISIINQRIEEHPLKILAFKDKVEDSTLIDEVARRTVSISLETVAEVLTDLSLFRHWVLYRERWRSFLREYRSRLSEFWSASDPIPKKAIPKSKMFVNATEKLGPPSRTTVNTAVTVFNLTPQPYFVRQEKALNAVLEVTDQSPRWEDI